MRLHFVPLPRPSTSEDWTLVVVCVPAFALAIIGSAEMIVGSLGCASFVGYLNNYLQDCLMTLMRPPRLRLPVVAYLRHLVDCKARGAKWLDWLRRWEA